jgi:uncharacterized protein (TIGR02117 family)
MGHCQCTVRFMLALFAATTLGCALPGPAPDNATTLNEHSTRTIYVVSHGWHTGMVIRRSDVPAGLWPESAHFPNAEYLEIGWGDRDYYMTPGFSLWLAIKALFWPSRSVLHVVGFTGSVVHNFPTSDVVELQLAASGLEALVHLIHSSHAREGAGPVAALRAGLYGDSRFYPSRERFHMFKTCNVWTARALRTAGLPLRVPFALTADAVIGQARQMGRCLRCSSDPVTPSDSACTDATCVSR